MTNGDRRCLMGCVMMTSLVWRQIKPLIPAAHSPDDTLGTGSDGTELLVPLEHRKGGVSHLHAVKLSLPLGHGSSHWVPWDKSNLREQDCSKWQTKRWCEMWQRWLHTELTPPCLLHRVGGWHCRWLIQGESDIIHGHTEWHRIPIGCH